MTDQEHVPALRLAIGTPLNIQVQADNGGTRLNARVLGMLEGASIIAHLLAPGPLRVGDKVSVRCLEGRSISGFRSTVIEICSSPYAHFHLSYPNQLERVEVRQSERVSVAIPVTVHTADGVGVTAEVRDLSASGISLSSPVPIEVGSTIEVSMYSPEHVWRGQVSVVRCLYRQSRTGFDTWRLGLRLESEADAPDIELFRRWDAAA